MSVKLMSRAWEMDLPTGQKMLLLALCDHANDDGLCYPAQDKLAVKCSMSKRAVVSHIKWLEDHGVIVRERRQKTNVRQSNLYYINLDNYSESANSACANSACANSACANSACANSACANSACAKSAPPKVQNLHSASANSAPSLYEEPSIEPSIEPSDIVNAAETETAADTPSMAEAGGSVDAGASTRTHGAGDGRKSAQQAGRADNQRRFAAIAEIYNGVFADCPGVRQVSFASSKTNAKRQKQIPAAWAIAKRRVLEWADEDGLIDGEAPNGRHCLDWFRLYFENCKRDPFINGSSGRAKGHENWKPDFEYILRAETMEARVFEGA